MGSIVGRVNLLDESGEAVTAARHLAGDPVLAGGGRAHAAPAGASATTTKTPGSARPGRGGRDGSRKSQCNRIEWQGKGLLQ